MKKLIELFIITILIICNIKPVFSDNEEKNIEISERIGVEINPEIKIYFNFFPKSKDFISAKLYNLNDSALYFLIESNSQNKTLNDTISLTKADLVTLNKIINNYEYLNLSGNSDDTLGIKWNKTLLRILQPRLKYYDNRNEIIIELNNKSIVEGDLIWADSSFIMVGPKNSKFIWQDTETRYKVFHYSEIERFFKPGNIEFKKRKDIYLLNLDYLQNLSSFQETDENNKYIVVPELTKLLKQKQSIYIVPNTEYSQSLEELILSKQKKFILSFDVSNNSIYHIISPNIKLSGISKKINTGKDTTINVISNMQLPENQTLLPWIMVEYKITDYYYLGLGFNYFQTDFKFSPEQPSGIDSKNMSILLFLSYNKSYRNPYAFDFFSAFEFSYIFGIIYENISNDISINTIYDHQLFSSNIYKLKNNNSIFGTTIDFKISYFITSILSIDVNLLANIVMPFKIDGWQYIIDNSNKLNINEENINYSCVGIKAGFGIRL